MIGNFGSSLVVVGIAIFRCHTEEIFNSEITQTLFRNCSASFSSSFKISLIWRWFMNFDESKKTKQTIQMNLHPPTSCGVFCGDPPPPAHTHTPVGKFRVSEDPQLCALHRKSPLSNFCFETVAHGSPRSGSRKIHLHPTRNFAEGLFFFWSTLKWGPHSGTVAPGTKILHLPSYSSSSPPCSYEVDLKVIHGSRPSDATLRSDQLFFFSQPLYGITEQLESKYFNRTTNQPMWIEKSS